jgi:hypothetical protein
MHSQKKETGLFCPVSKASLARVYVAATQLVSEIVAVAIGGPLLHLAPANVKGARIRTRIQQLEAHFTNASNTFATFCK